jgi:hypothetical protein
LAGVGYQLEVGGNKGEYGGCILYSCVKTE